MKTGTTSIQEILATHDNSVVLYPKVGLFRNAHHDLVFNCVGKQGRAPGGGNFPRGQLLDAFAVATEENRLNVLISTEWLGSHAGRADISDIMHALAARVSGGPPEVEILLACREHFDRAASLYGQRQKGRSGQLSPDAFISENIRDLCYAPLITSLRQTGFKVTPLNYHPSRDWIFRFFSYIGFPAEQITHPNSLNQSFAPWVLIARMAINRVLTAEDEETEKRKQKIIRRLKNNNDSYSSAQFIFSQCVAVELDSQFQEDKQFLSREFGLDLPSPNISLMKDTFFMTADSFKRVEDALEGTGRAGKQILEIISEYVRV